jgi:hypothetical protein
MDENQELEIERRVNEAIASCQNCPGQAELEQMQRSFHLATFNTQGPSDQSWPQTNEFNLPTRCTRCYIVENEYATDE